MSSVPSHRKPLKRRGGLLEAHRRLASQRFNEHVEEDRVHQRRERRHHLAQSLQMRDTIPTNDEIKLLLEKVSEQLEIIPTLLENSSKMLKIEEFQNAGVSLRLLSLPLDQSGSSDSSRNTIISAPLSETSLESSLEQLSEHLLSSVPFVSDVDRVFEFTTEHGGAIFPRLIEATLRASPDLNKVLAENILHFSLSLMALICWHCPSRAVDLNYLSTLHHVACHSRPLSLRCMQLALWSITILEENFSYSIDPSSDRPSVLSIESETQLISTTVNLIKTVLCSITHQLSNLQSTQLQRLSADPLVSVVGSLVSLGGLIGLSRVLFHLTATFSKHHRISVHLVKSGAVQSALSFLQLVHDGVFAPVDTDAFAQPTFAPDSALRRAVVDALLTIEQCVGAARHETSSPSIHPDLPPLQDLLTTVFILAYSSLNSHPIPTHPEEERLKLPLFPTANTLCLKALQSIVMNDSDVGMEQLASRPSDILVPAIHIIGLLCDHDISIHHGQELTLIPGASPLQLLSRFLQLDGLLLQTDPSAPSAPIELRLSRFIVPCLLSRHVGVKYSSLDLLPLLAVAGNHFESIALSLTSLAASILADPEPCFVHRAVVLFLLHISFDHNARYLPDILQLNVPPSSLFNALARSIDQRSPESPPPTPCGICGHQSVIDLILLQLNSRQFDLPLVNLCLDFLEELLNRAPNLKILLYRHGVIEKVESVQVIDDDVLFHRTVSFAQRYYDDFEEGENKSVGGGGASAT